MSPVTDDRIGELLRETFAGHEELADADRARSLAAAVLDGGRRQRRPVRRWVLTAAASVAVLAGGVGYAARDLGAPPDVPGTPTAATETATNGPRTDAGNRREAFARLESVVAGALVPTGAERVATAPAEELRALPVGIGINQQTATRFYRLTGTLDSVMRAIPTPPYEGFLTDGGMGEAGVSWGVRTRARLFGATDATVAHLPTQLLYTAARTAGGDIGLRVDAIGEWRPARTAELTIDPASVTGADVRLIRPPDQPPTRDNEKAVSSLRTGTLDADAVRPVITLLNEQYAAVQEVHSCPPRWGETRDDLVVHTTGGDVTVTIRLDCLGIVTLARGGTTLTPGLEGNLELDAAIESALTARPLATSTTTGR